MPVTIKDIAKIAGVSHTTVSRALRDSSVLAPDTIKRIKKIANEQGYLPSAVARGLKTRQSRALGVIVSSIADPFWGEVLTGIDDTLHAAGYSLIVAASRRDNQREKEIVRLMGERRVDGVILCSPPFNAEHGRSLQEYGLPIVVVNNQSAEDFLYSIYNDNEYGIRQAVRHLVDLGHRRIAYLGNRQGGRTTHERENGYRAEMRLAGLSIPDEYVCTGPDSTPQGGLTGVQHLLALPERPTGIVCYNDHMAIGVYSALYHAGLRVPQDVSVVGFDDIFVSAYLIPPLTTFRQPMYHLGTEAAKLLLYMLEQHNKDKTPPVPQSIRLRGELLVRASSMPPEDYGSGSL
jgi:DNA-binding LacI/PurR family transcriptional regulator